MKLTKRHSEIAGFTLVEVLVALLVLALALLALQVRMTQYLDDAAYLRDKTLASWVALNQLELLQIADRLELPGDLEPQAGSTLMLQRRWYWQLLPEAMALQSGEDAALLRLINMQVSPWSAEAALSEPLVTLVAVQGVDDAL